jgi:membrane-associated phospholipid phosphatase
MQPVQSGVPDILFTVLFQLAEWWFNNMVQPNHSKVLSSPAKSGINELNDRAWTCRQWLGWTIVPILIILQVITSLAWLTKGEPARISIWTMQQDWFYALNHSLSAWPELLWSNFTLAGDATVLLLILSPLLIFYKRAWFAMLGAVPAAAVFTVVGKYLAAMPRPAAVLEHDQFTIIGDILTRHNSLPSGHAITVFAGAIAILATITPHPQGWRQWLVVYFVLLMTALLSLSRVAVGAHWPLDILVGGALGWLAGLSGAAILRRKHGWQWGNRPAIYRFSGLAMLVWSLFLLERSVNEPLHAMVLCLAALCGILSGLWLLGQSPAYIPGSTQLSDA